jgi:hypothetical protein
MTKDEIEDILRAWALGDEAASAQLEALLTGVQSSDPSGTDSDFARAAGHFYAEHGDLLNEDDELELKRVDAQLAIAYPNAPYPDRLAAAGRAVRLGGFQPQGYGSDFADAISAMREARKGHRPNEEV